MQALLAHAKLHAFYLMALWFWGGILVTLKWWIALDAAACVLLTSVALAMRMHRSWLQSGRLKLSKGPIQPSVLRKVGSQGPVLAVTRGA